MVRPSIKVLAGAVTLALLAPSASYATNGYFMIGFGSKSRGMGGTGIARGQDSLAAGANPATAIDVETRIDIGAELFRAKASVRHNSGTLPTEVASNKDLFLIPNMGFSWRKSENLSINMAVIGAGMETNYDQTVAPGATSNFYNFLNSAKDEVGIQLYQMHMLPGFALKLDKTHTVGVSLDIVAQRFRARGLQAFGEGGEGNLGYSSDTDHLTNRDFDWSYGGGIRLGWQGSFDNDDIKLGAYYSSRGIMSKFKKYKGLFAEGGGFDIPPHFGVGVNIQATPSVNLAMDVQRIQYSEIASIGNLGPNAIDDTDFNPLCPGEDTAVCKTGGSLGMGFGWTDQTIYKFGVDYRATSRLITRFGYNYGKTPIQENEALFNMLAPAVVEQHITFGATYDWDKETELSFNFMHAFAKTFYGKSPFYPEGVSNYEDMQNGNVALTMKQTSLGFSYGLKF